MGKTTGDGPTRSSTGHRFGVRAALDAHVPVGWGQVKDSSPAEIAAYNARNREKKAAEAELADVVKMFPQKLKPLAEKLQPPLSAAEVLEQPEFKQLRRELERRRNAARRKPNSD